MYSTAIRLWEPFEIVLTAEKEYENCYRDVCVWVHLKGPGFDKSVSVFGMAAIFFGSE